MLHVNVIVHIYFRHENNDDGAEEDEQHHRGRKTGKYMVVY